MLDHNKITLSFKKDTQTFPRLSKRIFHIPSDYLNLKTVLSFLRISINEQTSQTELSLNFFVNILKLNCFLIKLFFSHHFFSCLYVFVCFQFRLEFMQHTFMKGSNVNHIHAKVAMNTHGTFSFWLGSMSDYHP